MPQFPEFFRTSAFRWTLASAALFACATAVILGFVYLQTTYEMTRQFDSVLLTNAADITAPPLDALPRRLADNLQDDPRQIRSGAVFDAAGQRLAGNIAALPKPLPPSGQLSTVQITRIGMQGRRHDEIARVIDVPLPDGRVLVLARDMEQVENVTSLFARAFALGAVPALLLALLVGAIVSMRAVRRLGWIAAVSRKIMSGQLDQRLPTTGVHGDFSRFSLIVNEMLDEIERLMTEVKGAGDAIAHDLRTPLTRMRCRLECARDDPQKSADELRGCIDDAMQDVDAVRATLEALLRIGEIEHGRRRAGFAMVDIAATAREVAELFAPVAEDKGSTLALRVDGPCSVCGDRDLLFETISNLVDNAIKFTPRGGRITLAVAGGRPGPEVVVTDTGPGIAPAERAAVTRRFYRGERCRRTPGVGLGLSLVAAVARLHDFRLVIRDGAGGRGSTVILECWPSETHAIAA